MSESAAPSPLSLRVVCPGLEFVVRVQGLGFRVQGSGFRVPGLGFKGLGF